MTRFTRALVASLAVVLFGFVMALVPQKNASGAPGGPHVTVDNVPLPITGGVNVTNTPLPVNVTNTPLPISGGVNVTNASVPISGFVTASVFNNQQSPIFIRDVDGRRAFQTLFSFDSTNPPAGVSCLNPANCQAFFDVPPGPGPTAERLVVEHISARMQGPTGQKYEVSLNCGTNDTGEDVIDFLELSFQGTVLNGTADLFTANQPTRAYCDETMPPPFLHVSSSGGAFSAIVSLSGYEIIQP